MKFNIVPNGESVSVCMDCNNSLDSFLDLFISDEDFNSPFKTVEDAKLFAEIIVKLLGVIYGSR